MQDMQTQSLWSQISGECIQGELEGTRLTLFPASQTTFAEFKKIYPDGMLLKKPEKGPEGSQYQSYFADSTKMGIFGRVESFERLGAKDVVFGIRQSGRQTAVSESYLRENGFCLFAD